MQLTAARNLTKSDTPNDNFTWVLVTTTAGTLEIESEGGNIRTITNVPTGVFLYVGNATNVRTASTAAGLIVQ